MPTSRVVRTVPRKASPASEASAPPRIQGFLRPVRSDRAPAMGLNAVAKTALTPPTTPRTVTLWAGSI